MILTLLLVQHVTGHVDVDGMDTSVAHADDILAFNQRRVLSEFAEDLRGAAPPF